MADYNHDSIYDILSSARSDTLSGLGSNEGSEHPSRECYMADLEDVMEGHVSDGYDSTLHGTPPGTPLGHGHAAEDPVDLADDPATSHESEDPIMAQQVELREAQCEIEE